MENRKPISREENSWILYDVGNSAFVLIVVTAIMPIFFKDIAGTELQPQVSTAYWGFANSAASLVLAILAPFLGTIADYGGGKKRFFIAFLAIGLIFCSSLIFLQSGQWFLCLVLFVLARIGWAGANIFYDAFLVDVTSKQRMDLISTKGYGYGYIGSVIPFLAVIGLIMAGGIGPEGLPPSQTKIGFGLVVAWWGLFSIPALKHLRPKHTSPSPSSLLTASLKNLSHTVTAIHEYRTVFLFLVAYFFYIDGVSTIISMSTAYARELGFSIGLLIGALLLVQVVAFPFALAFGKLADRYSTRNMLVVGIAIYIVVTLLAFILPALDDPTVQHGLYWCMAFLVAAAMGGVQALSRSYFGQLIPPEKSTEFFGFYNIFGKLAAIGGPFLVGMLGTLAGETRWGVLSLLFLFALGTTILLRLPAQLPRAAKNSSG